MRVIDLSKTVSPNTPVYPGDHPIQFETQSTHDQGYHLTRIHMSTHAGTHVDAPRHFLRSGVGITGLELDIFVGPAVLVDLGPLKPGENITPEHLAPHAGAFSPGARVIMRTGWTDMRLPHEAGHFTDHPVFTPDASRWMAARRPALIGMDLPSPHSRDHLATHGPLMEAGIVLLEGLVNLSGLPREFTLAALPLPLENLDGSPVRAVALIP